MRVAYSDHSSNPVCGFGSAKPVLLGTNSTEPNLFHHEETTYRVGWLIWICYSRALERRCLGLTNVPIFGRSTYDWNIIPMMWRGHLSSPLSLDLHSHLLWCEDKWPFSAVTRKSHQIRSLTRSPSLLVAKFFFREKPQTLGTSSSCFPHRITCFCCKMLQEKARGLPYRTSSKV